MKIKHFICLMLAAVMLMTMVSCVPPTPSHEVVTDSPSLDVDTATVTVEETETAEKTEKETETAEKTEKETETTAETWIPQPETLRGCIQDKTEDDLLKVKLSSKYKGERNVIVYVRVENIDDFPMWDDVILTYDAGRPVETMPTGEDILIAESMAYDLEIPVPEKPVIYLYPEIPTDCSVTLTLDGHFTCTYPDYDKGWNHFTAHPDGTLVFPDGKEYYCLYWEGVQAAEWDFSEGFCVKGEETAAFLEWALAEQGLTPREANEFIIYWLPLMQENPYNIISFQTDAYTDGAVLDVTPKPDSLIRVFMAWYAADTAVELLPQAFDTPARDGFTVVEWGGSQVREP